MSSSCFSSFKFMSMFIHFMEIFLWLTQIFVAHFCNNLKKPMDHGTEHKNKTFICCFQPGFGYFIICYFICCSITHSCIRPSRMSWLELLHCNATHRGSKRKMKNIVANRETCKFKNFKLFVGFVKCNNNVDWNSSRLIGTLSQPPIFYDFLFIHSIRAWTHTEDRKRARQKTSPGNLIIIFSINLILTT